MKSITQSAIGGYENKPGMILLRYHSRHLYNRFQCSLSDRSRLESRIGLCSFRYRFRDNAGVYRHLLVRLLSESIHVQNLQKTGQRENLMDQIVHADSLDASAAVFHFLRVGEKNAQPGRGDVIDL